MSISQFHLSLIAKNSILGVSQNTFSIEIGILFLVIFIKMYILIVLLPFGHFILKKIYLKDEIYLELYSRYSREIDFWDPWDHD